MEKIKHKHEKNIARYLYVHRSLEGYSRLGYNGFLWETEGHCILFWRLKFFNHMYILPNQSILNFKN